MKSIFVNNKILALAYDQGLEHGPIDFNLDNCNPEFIFRLAIDAGFTGLVVQPGIAEKYYSDFKDKVNLIVKLNGKTRLVNGDPISLSNCSVKRAIALGAVAVGYTIYVGSEHEHKMFKEFGQIVEEARNWKVPVIAWMYPRGKNVPDPMSTEILAYAARVGLELGADVVKVHYNGDIGGFKWLVKNAGRTKVAVAGGSKRADFIFLKNVEEVMNAGAAGMIIGRNIWQHEKPLKMAEAVRKIVFENQSAEEAIKVLQS
ncbi:MAG: fructose-bisphosphate aldolase, class [Candidatus Woesearchaeota archaeon]|nr:fructose-bisphosphate aldolase, class [Candidatus Woesearchaeota archaeon]MDN5327591.1 fructose-bisphosphate aldolase, class [Candidatus Woesearchaeota archaeon]